MNTDVATAGTSFFPILLGQIPAARDSQVLTVLYGGAALLAIAALGATLFKQLTGGFQRAEPPGPEHPTKAECQRTHDSLNATLQAMDERHTDRTEALRLEFKHDIKGVHSRIDDAIRVLGRIEGKLEPKS